ncbi:MAG TPA: GNAT family N-acetyltransferase [Actinoplanes sp.]|nr:GNAT family N-acetyltransferase [Actinoplanes sp.]
MPGNPSPNEARADAAARAWLKAIELLTDTQPGGYFRETGRGTAEAVTGIPVPSLNTVVAITRDPAPDEIAEFAASPRLAAIPWSVQVRTEPVDERIVRVAAGHGLTTRIPLPFMLRDLTEADTADLPGAHRITAADGADYQRTMAAGFQGPLELFAAFADPAVISLPEATGYLVEVDGELVATSFGMLLGDLVGVFNIAVSPQFRRRGYGRLATAAVLRDAYAAGARTAYLHATPDGYPLYLQMGFELVETWSVFVAGP